MHPSCLRPKILQFWYAFPRGNQKRLNSVSSDRRPSPPGKQHRHQSILLTNGLKISSEILCKKTYRLQTQLY